MSDPVGDGGTPPQTGDGEIDGALSELADLPTTPLSEHHDRLAAVHEVLHHALDRADEPDRG
jgi:hypothetical protein